ncbi:MAG: hypothetical protein WKF75_21195 [Singulisphaera sp.]
MDFPRPTAGLWLMPTTLQAHPHGLAGYARNIARRAAFSNLWLYILHGRSVDWVELARSLLSEAHTRGGVFHLWGHSWELQEEGQWRRLEDVQNSRAGSQPDARPHQLAGLPGNRPWTRPRDTRHSDGAPGFPSDLPSSLDRQSYAPQKTWRVAGLGCLGFVRGAMRGRGARRTVREFHRLRMVPVRPDRPAGVGGSDSAGRAGPLGSPRSTGTPAATPIAAATSAGNGTPADGPTPRRVDNRHAPRRGRKG